MAQHIASGRTKGRGSKQWDTRPKTNRKEPLSASATDTVKSIVIQEDSSKLYCNLLDGDGGGTIIIRDNMNPSADPLSFFIYCSLESNKYMKLLNFLSILVSKCNFTESIHKIINC